MPPKDNKPKKNYDSISRLNFSESSDVSPRIINLSLNLEGEIPITGDWLFLTLYNGHIILEKKWLNGITLNSIELPIDLEDKIHQDIVADKPITFILRVVGGKGIKDPDPLLNADNRAGASVDLFPLLLGEEHVLVNVPLVWIATGENTGCSVNVHAVSLGVTDIGNKIPLTITMYSAHCLPYFKDGTVFLSAIGLDSVINPVCINFGMSQSSSTAKKIMWASASNGGLAANTAVDIPKEDIFVPGDFEMRTTENCHSTYWYAMKRVLVDPILFRERLLSPFFIEIAGVPKLGKIEVRGRYRAYVDAGVMLEPGQCFVITSAKLKYYNETNFLDNVGPLLDLPSTSNKVSARDVDVVTDEYGHNAYIILRFDLPDPLRSSVKIASLFDQISFPMPEGPTGPVDELQVEPAPDDWMIDVRRIRKEGGALAVHKELSSLACRGSVQMNQSIKRTAANRLLMRIRSMLKQFSPGECSIIDWQDTVKSQHAACRRAVTASFAPQAPPLRQPPRSSAARSRMAGDNNISDKHIELTLKAAPSHPRSFLSKALRCLEARTDSEARQYILKALSLQTRNRYLLWIYGGQEFDKGPEALQSAEAAFRIAVKGEYSDGTSNAIGWAALHGLYHFYECPYAAFVAAKKMRKYFELPMDWKNFLEKWIKTSGEEEVFWIPRCIESFNPILVASAFFLCLRCYKFSEILLKCVETGCISRGSRLKYKNKVSPDIYYLRASSLLLRCQIDKAIRVNDEGIKRFGPASILLQMRASCLACARGWDGKCLIAMNDAEKSGAEINSCLLLRAAIGNLKNDPLSALQYASRAHKVAPSAQSALLIGRIYDVMNEPSLANRWAAVSVKTEGFYTDGWAFLALLAMKERDVNKAKTILRTAKQVGKISPDLAYELKQVMDIIKMDDLPDALVENLCLCKYY